MVQGWVNRLPSMYIKDVESININTSEYLTVLAKTQKFINVLLCFKLIILFKQCFQKQIQKIIIMQYTK